MPFGLIINTDRAFNLQTAIQDELTARGYMPDADRVLADYITIMIINNKSPAQITAELEDLIGSEFNPTFTDWLFAEAAKGAPASDLDPEPAPAPELPSQHPPKPTPSSPTAPPDPTRRPPPPRPNNLFPQALTSIKRPASARSPSPAGRGPAKSRRTETVPTGPRAMYKDGTTPPSSSHPSRSLLERVGGPVNTRNGPAPHPRDDIQLRIDNITSSSPDPSLLLPPFLPQLNAMDISAMAGISNPLILQEMMMNQMALMAQMASSMGMLNPATGQLGGGGFPMQGMGGEMGFGGANGFQQGVRGRGRGGRRGGTHAVHAPAEVEAPKKATTYAPAATPAPATHAPGEASTPIIAPVPKPAAEIPAATPAPSRLAYALPSRPQSPTLCKFGTKCSNSQCRYSHPSPVATAESGVVLSAEACESGKNCKDKDCVKSHVSPAVNAPGADLQKPPPVAAPAAPSPHSVPCRYGPACTRPNCPYTHPPRSSQNHFAQQCRFGASCTRASCPFQHPSSRILPSTFHRGLSAASPLVSVPTPETGSMGGGSPHKSVTFSRSGQELKDKIEETMKEIEEQKSKMEKAVAEAAGQKEGAAIAV